MQNETPVVVEFAQKVIEQPGSIVPFEFSSPKIATKFARNLSYYGRRHQLKLFAAVDMWNPISVNCVYLGEREKGQRMTTSISRYLKEGRLWN